MLSLFVVLFAAGSAFAALSEDIGDTLTVVSSTDITPSETEGYNYYQVVYIDGASSLGGELSTDFQARLGEVRWEVNTSGEVNLGPIAWTVRPYDVIIEGTLPAFDSSASVDVDGTYKNLYGLHVVAYASKEKRVTDDDGNESILTGEVSCDVDGTEDAGDGGLNIYVTKDPIGVDSRDIYTFTDLVSVDAASADGNISQIIVKNGYSVTVKFGSTYDSDSETTYMNAELPCESADGVATIASDYLNLPTWLKYEVVSFDESNYVKELRIFYSADEKPAMMGSVRIAAMPSSSVPNSDNSYNTKYTSYLDDSGNLTMGWFVFLPPAIWFDTWEVSCDAKYGTTTEVSRDLTYHAQTPVEVKFSPDISANVSIDWTATSKPTSDDENAGYITLKFTPVTPLITSYDTLMRVADSYDNYGFIHLVVNVTMDSMEITPVSNSITVDAGKSEDVVFTAANFNGKVISWDLGTIPDGITVTSSDSGDYGQTLTLTIAGVASGDYSFDVAAKDSFDRTASAVMYVKVQSPDLSGLKIEPASRSVTVIAGGNIVSVDFTVLDASGDVSWSFGRLPAGVTMVEANKSGDKVTFGVRASADAALGSHDVTITASDDRKTGTATLTITVTRSSEPVLRVTPSTRSVTVQAGGSAVNASFDVADFRGNVAWSYGTLPSGVTLSTANTRVGTQGIMYAVRAASTARAGSYSVTVTASDDVKTAAATLSITVTSASPVSASLTVSPSAPTVTVAVGASQNVTLTASNNSGLVTWTAGTPAGGFTIEPATDTSYATRDMTTMIYTVTGVTAGSYSVTVTATDTAGKTAASTIGVTVTSGSAERDVDINPTISITETLITTVKQAITSLFGIDLSGKSVVKLQQGLIGGSLKANVATANVVRFSEIRVSQDNVYVFGVPADNLTAGYKLSWDVVVSNAANDELIEASAAETGAVFLDGNGNVITTVPANKVIDVAAYFEANKTYTAQVTATPQESGADTGVSSASSGCTAGFGAMVSMLAAAFFISKKRS